MNRRWILAGTCLLSLLFFMLIPGSAAEQVHPCLEVYARCAALALSSNLSFAEIAEWLQSCNAMYVSCLVFAYVASWMN